MFLGVHRELRVEKILRLFLEITRPSTENESLSLPYLVSYLEHGQYQQSFVTPLRFTVYGNTRNLRC